ncbi:PIN domain-containing protein [Pseudomonas guariconensis]|uniref:PIN domain-containing protein n=1 Tax=Pseudomonas TaxID=286 RepID=UPI001CE40507|nr:MULTISPECIES: PIN domain-containing protein [Pseudomonas]MCO7639281.1 PIN domain-containing protein [Pseudomonas sp. S 311-6]MCO7516113.1 PIN domain-containing protein [Pseudomonas putida]MCO7565368.1 PIN domain-containing protein [Pseudomonas mosselii]MCO7594514.1 PIN domain-containing protein [Pseudomonas guariconensis]MCO7607581.1 PIN domain-containing protein [Pseudomonas guariconensis]
MRESSFIAIYDACVLYPAPLRDLLLRLAGKGLYRARWTSRIDEEWKRNLLRNRKDLAQVQLDRVSRLMEAAIPDALVTEYEQLCESLLLPDPDDAHVLAAAIRSNAEVIVTFNLKDFPASTLKSYGVQAQHPDEFIMDLWGLDQATVLATMAEMRRCLVRSPYTPETFVECILKQGLPQTASALNDYIMLI